jgi:hypothetical protein
VLDAFGDPAAGADVQVHDRTAVTAADGSFSIPGVRTIFGLLVVEAFRGSASGSSEPLTPVPGGITDAGDILLSAGPAQLQAPG